MVLQYTSRLDQDALASSLVAAGAGAGRGKSAFNFQLADAAASKAISGYEYNGLTPFGMTQSVPVWARLTAARLLLRVACCVLLALLQLAPL